MNTLFGRRTNNHVKRLLILVFLSFGCAQHPPGFIPDKLTDTGFSSTDSGQSTDDTESTSDTQTIQQNDTVPPETDDVPDTGGDTQTGGDTHTGGATDPVENEILDGWSECRKLTFSNSVSPENLVNFPVSIVLNEARFDYKKSAPDGKDIRFVDDDAKTLLDYEIENWVKNGTSVLWVKVPQIDGASNDDFIWMCHGNPSAGHDQCADCVWSENYLGVWHLADKEGTNAADATGQHNGIYKNSPTLHVAGWFGDMAAEFDGSDDYVQLGHINVIPVDGNTGITLEAVAWLDPNSPVQSRLISKATSLDNDDHFWMLSTYAHDASSYAARFRLKLDGETEHIISDVGAIQKGGWAYITATYDGSKMKIYANGQLIEEAEATGEISKDDSVDVHVGANPGPELLWKGRIAEVRISNTHRSSSWIAAQYRAMATDAPNPLVIY